MPYPKNHMVLDYQMDISDIEELTTYGGEPLRSFTDEQIDALSKELKDVIQDVISDFLNHNQ